MFEYQFNSNRLFVVVLVLVYRRVVAILIRVRTRAVADSQIAPAQFLCDFSVLRRERDRSTAEEFADIANLCNPSFALLFIL